MAEEYLYLFRLNAEHFPSLGCCECTSTHHSSNKMEQSRPNAMRPYYVEVWSAFLLARLFSLLETRLKPPFTEGGFEARPFAMVNHAGTIEPVGNHCAAKISNPFEFTDSDLNGFDIGTSVERELLKLLPGQEELAGHFATESLNRDFSSLSTDSCLPEPNVGEFM